MTYLLFIAGFVLLILGADWLVKGAREIAIRFGVSELVIGLTIVSIGTSMPELLVSVLASAAGNPGLATGNILGSNIANILLILGTTAVICNLPVQRSTVLSEIPFSLTAALLVGFLANTTLWYEQSSEHYLSRSDGLILLFFFLLFLVYVLNMAQEEKKRVDVGDSMPAAHSLRQSAIYIILGISGLFLGGRWVVDGALQLAGLIGMSEAFIGLTIVAVGTSLPELVTSLMAGLKKNTDIAVGNAIGSNIFNLLWILGLSSLIEPLPFNATSNVDILMVIVASTMILVAMVIGHRRVIRRIEGVVFLIAYGVYLYFLVKRG